MKPLSIIYWSRVCFGIVSAIICVVGWASLRLFDSIFEGLSLALIVYIITYYILKWRFLAQVEKPSKVVTTGIGAYFLMWALTWALLFTLLNPPFPPPPV